MILAVKYTPAGSPSSVRRAVGGFLRYVQYRDQHRDSVPTPDPEVEGLLKYIAFRDKTSKPGQLFDADGPAGTPQRRRLAQYVANSLSRSEPAVARGQGGSVDRRRAVYRFVLSPERAEGLDLRLLTIAAIERLEADAGPGAPLRWLAAEHRNTAHPHVHIVLAGMREVAPGRYRSLVITRPRLANMKEAIGLEVERQRALQAGRVLHPVQLPRLPVHPSAVGAFPVPARPRPVAPIPPPARANGALAEGRPSGHRRCGQWLWARMPSRSRQPLGSWHLRRLRAMAGRYRWETARDAEEERRRLAGGRER